jgi:hypothetical protein
MWTASCTPHLCSQPALPPSPTSAPSCAGRTCQCDQCYPPRLNTAALRRTSPMSAPARQRCPSVQSMPSSPWRRRRITHTWPHRRRPSVDEAIRDRDLDLDFDLNPGLDGQTLRCRIPVATTPVPRAMSSHGARRSYRMELDTHATPLRLQRFCGRRLISRQLRTLLTDQRFGRSADGTACMPRTVQRKRCNCTHSASRRAASSAHIFVRASAAAVSRTRTRHISTGCSTRHETSRRRAFPPLGI